MADTIGAAVIGLDHWYSAFMVLDQIVADEDIRLVAIAEKNASHLEEARQKYSPETSVADYGQILDDERIDVVFSFVPTAHNVEICMESLGRGKHTFCVKPPALTVKMPIRSPLPRKMRAFSGLLLKSLTGSLSGAST